MAKLVNRLRDSVHLDRDNAWLFGVCAGLANYWNTDPAIRGSPRSSADCL